MSTNALTISPTIQSNYNRSAFGTAIPLSGTSYLHSPAIPSPLRQQRTVSPPVAPKFATFHYRSFDNLFSILFFAQLFCLVYFSFLASSYLPDPVTYQNTIQPGAFNKTISNPFNSYDYLGEFLIVLPKLRLIYIVIALLTFTMSVIYYSIMFQFPRQLLYGLFAFSTFTSFLGGALLYIVASKYIGIPLLVVGGMYAVLFLISRPKIASSTPFLEVISEIIIRKRELITVIATTFIFDITYLMIWLNAMFSSLFYFNRLTWSNVNVKGGEVTFGEIFWYGFLAISAYWSLNVFNNIRRMIGATIVATFFFAEARNQNCTYPSVYRGFDIAMTYSFGSLCFDGLVRPAVSLFSFLLESISSNLVAKLTRVTNGYAVSEIAISPKKYAVAAGDAMDTMVSRGFNVFESYLCIGTAMSSSSLSFAFIPLIIANLWSIFILDSAYPAVSSLAQSTVATSVLESSRQEHIQTVSLLLASLPSLLLSFLVTYAFGSLYAELPKSMLVSFSKDPDGMARICPAVAEKVDEVAAAVRLANMVNGYEL